MCVRLHILHIAALVGFCSLAVADDIQTHVTIAGMQPYVAGVVKIDASGKATFLGVPAGSYYIFGTTHANHLALSWDVRVDLKSGTNSLVLDQKNAEMLQ